MSVPDDLFPPCFLQKKKKKPPLSQKTTGDNQIYKMEKCLVRNILEKI